MCESVNYVKLCIFFIFYTYDIQPNPHIPKPMTTTHKPKLDPNIYYERPKLYYRPMRPYEKAYTFWYIEMFKPPHERDQTIIDAKYAFAGRTNHNHQTKTPSTNFFPPS